MTKIRSMGEVLDRHKQRMKSGSKGDRALELFEKGITPHIIAERLGISRSHVYEAIEKARARRAKAKEMAE